jgi:hypothetical protein
MARGERKRRAPHASVVSDLAFLLQSKVTAAKNQTSDDEDDDEANNHKAVRTGTAGRRFVE